MKKHAVFLLGILMVCFLALPASATLIGVSGIGKIITAPSSVLDDDGANNEFMLGFDEAQGVNLSRDIKVDSGFIGKGTLVNSHMIYLNTIDNYRAEYTAGWEFDGLILGVMSDNDGRLEAASNDLLGAGSTTYPGSFNNRGFESSNPDDYAVSGNHIKVLMLVTEPGDWIRVVTAAKSVPEPSTMLLLGLGILGIGFCTRKKFQQ